MVQHTVMWKLKEELDKSTVYNEMKDIFYNFRDEVPGMKSLNLYEGFDGADIVLISIHENAKALEEYQRWPAHLNAKKYVHSVIKDRCFSDFEIE